MNATEKVMKCLYDHFNSGRKTLRPDELKNIMISNGIRYDRDAADGSISELGFTPFRSREVKNA